MYPNSNTFEINHSLLPPIIALFEIIHAFVMKILAFSRNPWVSSSAGKGYLAKKPEGRESASSILSGVKETLHQPKSVEHKRSHGTVPAREDETVIAHSAGVTP